MQCGSLHPRSGVDPGPTSRDDVIFSDESLFRERKSSSALVVNFRAKISHGPG